MIIKNKITSEKAKSLLKEGLPLIDVSIEGELRIESSDSWDKEIIFENCIIDFFSGTNTQFEKPVKFINCHFKNCHFTYTYFFGGLTIKSCVFDNYLDFQAGGHNKIGNSIILEDNNFNGFVNFFDCWYESEVIITNNQFHNGTNLLGQPHQIPVTFDKEPIIKNNLGQLNLDNEGEKNE